MTRRSMTTQTLGVGALPRVIGVRDPRVENATVMPNTMNSNTTAPSIMIGETRRR